MASRARSRGARWRRGPQVPAWSGERPDSRGSGSGAAGGLPRAGGALRPRERGLRAPFSPRLSGSEKWSPGSRLRRDSVKLTLVLRSALRSFFSRFALCPFSCVLVPHAGDHTSISAPRSGWEPPAPSSSQGRHECFSSPQRPLFPSGCRFCVSLLLTACVGSLERSRRQDSAVQRLSEARISLGCISIAQRDLSVRG